MPVLAPDPQRDRILALLLRSKSVNLSPCHPLNAEETHQTTKEASTTKFPARDPKRLCSNL